MLALPFGWLLVMGVGLGMVGYGLHELYNSYQANFEAYLKRDQMSNTVESVIINGGRFGLAARGSCSRSWVSPLPWPRYGSIRARLRVWAALCKNFFDSPSGPGFSAYWRWVSSPTGC